MGFGDDAAMQKKWKAFVRKINTNTDDYGTVLETINVFLAKPFAAAIEGIEYTACLLYTSSIMGASGSGKTTLLNCISTVDCVSAGHIYLNTGKQGPSGIMDITAVEQGAQAKFRRENLGFVVQDFNLLDRLTIEENIALPLVLLGLPAEKVHAKSVEMMERLGIGEIADVYKRQHIEFINEEREKNHEKNSTGNHGSRNRQPLWKRNQAACKSGAER